MEAFVSLMAPIVMASTHLQATGAGGCASATALILEIYRFWRPALESGTSDSIADNMQRLAFHHLRSWLLSESRPFLQLQDHIDPLYFPLKKAHQVLYHLPYPYHDFDTISPFRFGLVCAALDPRLAVKRPGIGPSWITMMKILSPSLLSWPYR